MGNIAPKTNSLIENCEKRTKVCVLYGPVRFFNFLISLFIRGSRKILRVQNMSRCGGNIYICSKYKGGMIIDMADKRS